MSSGCGCKEVFILLIPTPLVSALFGSSIPVHLKKCFSFLFLYIFVIYVIIFLHI